MSNIVREFGKFRERCTNAVVDSDSSLSNKLLTSRLFNHLMLHNQAKLLLPVPVKSQLLRKAGRKKEKGTRK